MFSATFAIALRSLLAARTRTILTTIGISIGVASILLVFAAGTGAREKATENLGSIPAGTALLASGTGTAPPGSAFESSATRTASVFTERDLASLTDSGLVQASAPIMEIAGPVSYREKTDRNAFIGATSNDLFRLLGLTFVDGGGFDDTDTSSIVLGNSVAESLFGTELASGKTLSIRGDTYTVTGVLRPSPLPGAASGIPVNDTVYIPYAQAKKYTAGVVQFSRVFAATSPSSYGRLTDLIKSNHEGQLDFTVSQASRDTQESPLLAILVGVTTVTAGLSLLIGGVGIMNIMLVNVSERTREIGIRKSIGASNAMILVQFCIESAVMSLAGGVLGVLVGLGAGVIGGLILPFGLLFTPAAIFGVLGLSLGIGILFGLFPAIRAARKDTIEALRYYQ